MCEYKVYETDDFLKLWCNSFWAGVSGNDKSLGNGLWKGGAENDRKQL